MNLWVAVDMYYIDTAVTYAAQVNVVKSHFVFKEVSEFFWYDVNTYMYDIGVAQFQM